MKIERFIGKKKIYDAATTDVITAGSTVTMYVKTTNGHVDSWPTVALHVVDVFDEGRGFSYNRLASDATDFYASELMGPTATHSGPTYQVCDYALEGLTAAVASIQVGGANITLDNFSYAVSGAGATALQDDLNEWLVANHPYVGHQPIATVNWNDLATDTLDIYVNGSQLVFDEVNTSGTPVVFVASGCTSLARDAVYPVPA